MTDPYNTAPHKPDPWKQEKVKKDRRAKNPVAYIIYARRRQHKKMVGEWLWWDGHKFTNNNAPHYFGTSDRARGAAKALKRRHRVLDQYRLYVGRPNRLLARVRRRNPAWPSEQDQLEEAAHRLEDFTGHPAKRVIKVGARSQRRTALKVGDLTALSYCVKRDGVEGGRLVEFEHLFREGSRPLLAVSSDGKQLHIVGGRYEFTEAGIEDR